MRRPIHLVPNSLTALTAVLLAMACDVPEPSSSSQPGPGECNRDSDCDRNQLCSDGGECVERDECTEDDDCDGDDVCDDGTCVGPETECSEDDDCDGDDVCDDGSCVSPEAECSEDDDCDGDDVCDDGTCVGPETECSEDDDCNYGGSCEDELCVFPSNVLVIGGGTSGGQVTTDDGTALTFGSGSLAEGTAISIDDIEYETLQSADQTFDVLGGVQVEMDGTADTPAVMSVPNQANLEAGGQILLVEVVELPDGTSGVNLVGTASVSEDGESIVSNNEGDSELFPGEYGIDESGTYVLIATEEEQGLTVGQVTDEEGEGVAGASVLSSSGTFVGVTDGEGYFAIPESMGSSTLYVTDPSTGSYANVYVAVGSTPQEIEITLITPASTANGLPNGCFDLDDFDDYRTIGNTAVVPTLAGIVPQQGGGMVLMTTGEGARDGLTSGLDLTLSVPESATSLRFSYRFLSNEYPEYVGSQYNDLFNVIAYTGQGASLVLEQSVNDAAMEPGEAYGGATPWRGVTVDVSAQAGSDLTLSFMVSDVGDAVVDTAVLIDNLRFDEEECENPSQAAIDADQDGYSEAEDCNDADAAIHPAAAEVCGDREDNDCDAVTDEDCAAVGTDADQDGSETPTDCDDSNAAVNPSAPEVCDEVDNDCDGEADEGCNDIVDDDGDTYPPETDCNDQDATIYPGAPEACDQLDNNCNGSADEACVQSLPQSHHIDLSLAGGFVSEALYAIYQRFDATTPLDLDGYTLTFVPDANHTRYTVTAGALAWDEDEGTLLSGGYATECDDCFDTQTMPFAFDFYGTSYETVYIGSNGYLTFSAGDSTYTESVEYFLAGNPRISAMFDDLDTRGSSVSIADDISVYSSSEKLVVTFRNIQHYSVTGTSNTFQFVLSADGTIRISYDGLEDLLTGCVAGISPGMITTTISG